MTFRVLWSEPAANDLADLISNQEHPGIISQAVRRIDQQLRSEGPVAGESRVGSLRILIESGFTCYFRYRNKDQTIIVAALSQRRK